MAYTTINKSSLHMNAKLYTGTGATQSITGINFQPDMVWIKKRNGATSHTVTDSVRGVNKQLFTNETAAEESYTSVLTAFDSDGFSLSTAGLINASSDTYASWNWKANGAGSANTDGTISSTVSANTTSGFSIVSYTGTSANATVGHGLGSAPKMIIVKNRTGTQGWGVYHASLGNTKYLQLNDSAGEGTASTFWNNTTPTNQLFSIGTSGWVNDSGSNYIAYCFAEKTGYSKFGSYTGNGSTDGTFVYTGFKPAFVLTKYSTSTSGWWQILDNKRDVYNPTSHALFANVNDSEYNLSNYHTDYLSNGFKLRNTQAGGNTSGGSYIYMAFAEEPLVGDNPATAR
jgi:hypothetical protein